MQHLITDKTEAFFSMLKPLSFWRYPRLYVEEFPYSFFHITSITYRVNIVMLSNIPFFFFLRHSSLNHIPFPKCGFHFGVCNYLGDYILVSNCWLKRLTFLSMVHYIPVNHAIKNSSRNYLVKISWTSQRRKATHRKIK